MTVVAARFGRRGTDRWPLAEIAAFAGAVVMLLIYSQGWQMPLTGGEETADSALIRAGFLPAYAISVALLAMAPGRFISGVMRQPFLVLLLAIAGLSMLWSVAPDQTSRRLFALVFTTLGGVIFAARYSWTRLAEVMAASFAALAIVSLLVCVFDPSLGRMTQLFPGAWRGLWPEKNAFGGNMAFGTTICAATALLAPRRALLWWASAALCLMLVLLSTSKTALVSMLLGLSALGLVWLVRRGPAVAVAATWAAVAGLVLVAAVMFFAADLVFGLLGKDDTLTGRTKIWAAVLRQIHRRPWQGYGYAAIWTETGRWGPLAWITRDAGFQPDHSHNSWLEQWLAMGVPGLVAWSGLYLQTLAANVAALYRHKGAYLAMPFFAVYSLMTLTESIAVVYNDMRWVVFVALAVKLTLPDPSPARAAISGRSAPAEQRRPLGHRHRSEAGV